MLHQPEVSAPPLTGSRQVKQNLPLTQTNGHTWLSEVTLALLSHATKEKYQIPGNSLNFDPFFFKKKTAI